MIFINPGQPTQVRIQEGSNRFKWELVKTGETIELPRDVGLRYGFEEVKATEGNIGETKVETKQIEQTDQTDDYSADDLFFKELTKINGIGPKTAKDIVVWGTKEKLIEQINLKADLPFRDDIVKLLEKEYA